jgi:hypothetical protein
MAECARNLEFFGILKRALKEKEEQNQPINTHWTVREL